MVACVSKKNEGNRVFAGLGLVKLRQEVEADQERNRQKLAEEVEVDGNFQAESVVEEMIPHGWRELT